MTRVLPYGLGRPALRAGLAGAQEVDTETIWLIGVKAFAQNVQDQPGDQFSKNPVGKERKAETEVSTQFLKNPVEMGILNFVGRVPNFSKI